MNTKKLKKKAILIAIFLLFPMIGLLVLGYEYYQTNHRNKFSIDENLTLYLKSDECGFCFLDWDIDFNLAVIDKEENKSHAFEFYMTQGPYLNFYTSTSNKKKFLIAGYGNNSGDAWLVNLEEGSCDYLRIEDSTIFNQFIEQKQLTGTFEIVDLQND